MFLGIGRTFRTQKGVLEITAGYTGGLDIINSMGIVQIPTYENHSGFAEALEIVYDDSLTNYKNLLDFFFQIHNPTTLNRQGNDIGDSYRSAIFYQDESELVQAKEFINIVNKSGRWGNPVVTTLEPFMKFYRAEEYHQDYLQKNPAGYTCHSIYFDSYLK